MKVIWKIISFILILILMVISFISMITVSLINSTEKYLSRENITATIKQMSFKDIVGDKVNKELNNILTELGIPNEYVDKVLESGEIKEFLGNYTASGIEYILYDKKIETPSVDEITNTLLDSFDYIVKEAENNNINVQEYLSKEDQEEIKKEIKNNASKIAEKLPDAEKLLENVIMQNEEMANAKEKLDQVRNVLDKVQMIFKYKFVLYIVILVSLALIVLLRLKHLKFIKYLMIPFTLTGGLLFVIYKELPILINKYYPKELNMIKPYLESSLTNVYALIKTYSILCLVVLLILIVVQVIVLIYYKKQEDKEFSEL